MVLAVVATGALPMLVALSKKVTVPVGAGFVPLELTKVENVTADP